MTKRFLATILTMVLFLSVLTPATAQAATPQTTTTQKAAKKEETSKPPYCRISYDTEESFQSTKGCYTLRYYAYNAERKFFEESASRLVKYRDGIILLGINGKNEVTSKHNKTAPGWNTDSAYLVWQETDNSVSVRNFKTGKTYRIAENVSSLNMNSETMVESVTFLDGTTKSINDLLPSSTATTTPPTTKPANTPNTESNSGNSSKPDKTSKSSSKVEEWKDSAGQHHFKFGKNEVIVDGKKIYLNDYRISELCTYGVRFIGIDTSGRVYLYEDKTISLYRFKVSNIFKPDKIKFKKGTKLQNIVTNKKGCMTKVVTSSGTFTVKQLVVDKTWYPKKSYVINKQNYCTYYMAETSKTYTLTLKGNKLYLGKKLVAKGITRKTESFGLYKNYIRYIYKENAYQKKIGSKKATIWKRNVKKLKYDTKKTGFAIGAK